MLFSKREKSYRMILSQRFIKQKNSFITLGVMIAFIKTHLGHTTQRGFIVAFGFISNQSQSLIINEPLRIKKKGRGNESENAFKLREPRGDQEKVR